MSILSSLDIHSFYSKHYVCIVDRTHSYMYILIQGQQKRFRSGQDFWRMHDLIIYYFVSAHGMECISKEQHKHFLKDFSQLSFPLANSLATCVRLKEFYVHLNSLDD